MQTCCKKEKVTFENPGPLTKQPKLFMPWPLLVNHPFFCDNLILESVSSYDSSLSIDKYKCLSIHFMN